MKQKVNILTSLLLMTTFVFGQTTNKDSLKIIRDSLKIEIERAKKIATGCTDFEIHRSPKWADPNLTNKTYYKNCMWSGTYIVISSDSTFLYKHNGEGPANYLQKGNWQIENDSILILRGSNKLTNEFKERIKRFENTEYRPHALLLKKFIRKQNALLEYEL